MTRRPTGRRAMPVTSSRTRRIAPLVVTLAGALLLAASLRAWAQPPTPESHFGFQMGAEGRLASADAIEQYFEAVAAHSDRVKTIDLGPTTEGHRTIAAIVSSPENIRNLDRIRAVNRRLSDPRTLEPAAAKEAIASHKVVLAIGCSIHASEVGATQAANELLHLLAVSNDRSILNVLDEIVIILIPSLNPDGHR